MNPRPQIFFCYATEDKDKVDDIYLLMKDAGLNPWMDKPPPPFQLNGISLGHNWKSVIRKKIRESAYFIAFLSPASVGKKGYVQKEYIFALDAMGEMPPGQTFLIPALLEECTPPETIVDSIQMRDLQWINLQEEPAMTLIRFLEQDSAQRKQDLAKSASAYSAVVDVDEFFSALGSNRSISVDAEELRLDLVRERFLEHVNFGFVQSPTTAVGTGYIHRLSDKIYSIESVVDMHIRGAQSERPRLLMADAYANVMTINGSRRISLANLVLGHYPEPGHCRGGVIHAVGCRDFLIGNCDLFGCGTIALTLSACEDVTISRSTIRDCSHHIAVLARCKNVTFSDCVISGHNLWPAGGGIEVKGSFNILFERCRIEGNVMTGPLIKAEASTSVRLVDCEISDNRFVHRELTAASRELFSGDVRVEGCVIKSNSFPSDKSYGKFKEDLIRKLSRKP